MPRREEDGSEFHPFGCATNMIWIFYYTNISDFCFNYIVLWIYPYERNYNWSKRDENICGGRNDSNESFFLHRLGYQ